MSTDQASLFALIGALFVLLIWGRYRYDLVAFGALLVAYLLGLIPTEEVFAGFGHPAVIIIALVLIISRGLYLSGAIELIAGALLDGTRRIGQHIALMAGVSAALSALMNNVAALALLMPVDLQAAEKAERSPALTLMPLSFASILGGMITLIGTPPNIVIATFRGEALGTPYTMFDFAPVGIAVATVGIVYVAVIGWRLIPVASTASRNHSPVEDLERYLAELRVPSDATVIGERLRTLDSAADESGVQILGLIRDGERLPGMSAHAILQRDDRIVVEGGPDSIDAFVGSVALSYTDSDRPSKAMSGNTVMREVAVPSTSRLVGRSDSTLRLRYRHGVILLGISRNGVKIRERLREVNIQAGDLLLLLGPEDTLDDVMEWMGCLPLAPRGLDVIQRDKARWAIILFGGAIALASLELVYLPIALACVALLYILLDIVPLSQVYESVEWPVIILLGAMIPISVALEVSGGTELLADLFVQGTQGWPIILILTALMVVTMTLSDVLNNVATALIAAPIALDVALRLQVNPDPFLMAVAVAASCAFLTPIGHKNNTLIMGPGGYAFGDYWRMGLPLEILVVITAIPMILLVWPLS
ncbi:SLC13 family permease [Luminiphilus sp.]|jgi:di/tricarboxylate transporter|nr:SLC13 family permease [Luminiphilus sp.]MDC0571867.1 SLC13 family permease [Luminiphilus sp.]MDC6473079.1 SLC13 family permease [Luminiphilus sp.]